MINMEWKLGDFSATGIGIAAMRAAKRAGTDASRAMKAEANRAVREKKRFPVSTLNAGMPMSRPDDTTWQLRISGAPQPVARFHPRQTRVGVSAGINVGKTARIAGAFIATMKSGHRGVFYRLGKSRLPIDEAFTTRISDVFRDDGVVVRVLNRARSAFAASFARQMK